MSLVQEALKRKTEEQSTQGSAPPPPLAGTPPTANTTPPPRKKGGVKALIFWLFFLVILGCMTYAIFYFLNKGLFQTKKEQPPETSISEPETAPEQTDIIPQKKPKNMHSTAYNLLKKTKDIQEKELADSYQATTVIDKEMITAPPTPAATPLPRPTSAPIIKRTPQTVSRRKAPSAKPTQKPPPDWPRIKLNGVMATKDTTKGIAVLDNQVTTCGQYIDDVKLISVHPDGVLLEYEGEIRTLRVGGEMY